MIKMNDRILDLIPQSIESPIPDDIFREILLLGPLVGHEKFLANASTFLPVGILGGTIGLILHQFRLDQGILSFPFPHLSSTIWDVKGDSSLWRWSYGSVLLLALSASKILSIFRTISVTWVSTFDGAKYNERCPPWGID